jgi:hypothetical protein
MCAAGAFTGYAQAPSGTITGTVSDSSGAVVPGASVTVTDKSSSIGRSIVANSSGLFSAPALPSGEYQVRVEVPNFRTVVRDAEVQAGGTTTVDIMLSVGTTAEIVNVEAASAQINYESNTVQGVIQRQTIQDIPLNGRTFLQLAALQPGVTISAGSTSTYNGLASVTINGQAKASYTVDGGNIVNQVLGSWNSVNLNISQELVQEFQIATSNFDAAAAGISPGGQINIVTRSGSNNWHGSGYYFYRDHNMAAYPLLQRSTVTPDPFFARRNPGFWVGGPVIKNKAFFFFNLEHFNQTQVFGVQQDLPSLKGLTTVNSAPYSAIWPSIRFDYHISDKNVAFLRYTHDGNSGTGPGGGSPLYSWYTQNYNWSDQVILALTSTLTPAVVNDARLVYHYFYENTGVIDPAKCVSPCIGGGLPSIMSMVGSGTFQAGEYYGAPQVHTSRSFEFIETLNWQKGAHRFRFGADYERMNTYYQPVNTCNRVCLGVYSVETLRNTLSASQLSAYFPNLPTSITTNNDLLNLPFYGTAVAYYSGLGVGSGYWPGPYNFDKNRINDRPQFYGADSWKIRPNLTLNFALRWYFENGLFNSDLPRPAFLAPILQGQTDGQPYGLGAPQPNMKNFSPIVGFAWSPFKNNKTVIRGGGGIYYDTMQLYQRWRDSAEAGPLGNGRIVLAPSILTNIFPGILNFSVTSGGQPTAVPVGAPLPLTNITNISLGQFMQIYNQELPELTARLIPPTPITSGPFTTTGLDIAKQALELYPSQFPVAHSYQTSIGIQQDLGHGMVLTADFSRKVSTHLYTTELDLNRYSRYLNGVNTPVIPKCTAAQLYVPGVECSSGPVTVWSSTGRAVYDGLLINLQKRLSSRYQFNVSYALQKNLAVNNAAVNLDDLFASYGPNLARHNLSGSGSVNLPWGFSISMNSSFISRPPVNPTISNVDLNGAGTSTFPLSEAVPGIGYNCFNAGCSKDDLVKAVDYWNANIATATTGKRDARGATIPSLTLPTANYQLSRPTITQDFRVTKNFKYRERYKLQIFGEVFNAFNISNLSGFSYSLTSPTAFGQPTQRVDQTFGSTGPRAFQLGGRFSF